MTGAGDARLTWTQEDADPRRLAQLLDGVREATADVGGAHAAYRPLEALADLGDLLHDRRSARNADDEELKRVAGVLDPLFVGVTSRDDASGDDPSAYAARVGSIPVSILTPAVAAASCEEVAGLPRFTSFASSKANAQLRSEACADASVLGLGWSDPPPERVPLTGVPFRNPQTGAPDCSVTVSARWCDASRGWRPKSDAPDTCEVAPLLGADLEACKRGSLPCASGWMIDESTDRLGTALHFTGGALSTEATSEVICQMGPK